MTKQPGKSRFRCFGLVPFFCCLGLTAGCHALHFTPETNDPLNKDSAQAATPSKRPPFRISQFVFFADFDVNRRLPIFTELANLREQVYKELQLPSANTVVQVYLFEDRP